MFRAPFSRLRQELFQGLVLLVKDLVPLIRIREELMQSCNLFLEKGLLISQFVKLELFEGVQSRGLFADKVREFSSVSRSLLSFGCKLGPEQGVLVCN